MSDPRIFLVRHGESVSNLDKKVHFTVPDHAIGLSDLGKDQAYAAGKFLADNYKELSQDNSCLWVSPYKRTRQTANAIQSAIQLRLGFQLPQKESINLVEQQFGLFDGYTDEELAEKYPLEHAHYNKCESFEGKFWARMPLGESRFDVAVRVHQFFGTLMRDYEKHNIKNIIIVAHGVTNRAFAMQWLHHPFEWFEKEPNPKNCSIRRIDGDQDFGYIHSGK